MTEIQDLCHTDVPKSRVHYSEAKRVRHPWKRSHSVGSQISLYWKVKSEAYHQRFSATSCLLPSYEYTLCASLITLMAVPSMPIPEVPCRKEQRGQRPPTIDKLYFAL